MKLVFLHGRSQQGKNPGVLKKAWVDAYAKGLAKSGITLEMDDADIIFPYYGKMLDELTNGITQPIEDMIARGDGGDNKEAAFFHDYLLDLATNMAIPQEEIMANVDGQFIEMDPQNWPWVLALARAIDKRAGWGERVIENRTKDVFLYLTNAGIRRQIDTFVKNSIPDGPCVIACHSLGTLIMFNVLRSNPALNIGKLITVGSPLGLNSIRKYVSPIGMPRCVQNGWFNAFDPRDAVALRPLYKPFFDIDPDSIENKNDVNNFTSDRHGIEGYLSDATVARKIHEALGN